MRLTRTFSKRANARGRLVYRWQKKLPVRIDVRRACLTLANADARQELTFMVSVDGIPRIELSGPGDRPFVSEGRFRIPRGQRELLVRTSGFEANQLVEGAIEIEYSFF